MGAILTLVCQALLYIQEIFNAYFKEKTISSLKMQQRL